MTIHSGRSVENSAAMADLARPAMQDTDTLASGGRSMLPTAMPASDVIQGGLAGIPRQIQSVAAIRAMMMIIGLSANDPWTSALCAQSDIDAWYPDQGQSGRTAVRICVRCPLIRPCLRQALVTEEEHGVWGGLTAPQRQSLLKVLKSALGDRPLAGSGVLEAALTQFTGPAGEVTQ
jgi:WhiB family transcriptional regulator, redox-sensing transcriptional regulator